MDPHFAEVGVVADVVAGAVFVEVGVDLGFTGEPFRDFERFEDGGAVGLAAPEVVNLASLRCSHKRGHETGDVEGVDIIANLFSLVSEDLILPSF